MGHGDMVPGTPYKKQRTVWFSGSTALRLGQSVCYDTDRVTDVDGAAAAATVNEPDRMNVVELPSTTNSIRFAGVTDKAYEAVSGGQNIVINLPGSTCDVAVGGLETDITINSTLLTFNAGGPSGYTGLFGRRGLMGRGTALALQSLARGVTAGTSPAQVYAAYGAAFTSSNGRIAITGIETYAKAGDTVVVLSGAQTTTAANVVTPYATTVATVGTNYVTLTTAPLAADGHVTVWIYRSEPTVLAYLYDGEESGGTQFVAITGVAPAASPSIMACGTIFIDPTATLSADFTHALSAFTKGQTQKWIQLTGATGANDVLVTGASAFSWKYNGSAFTTTGDLDADGDFVSVKEIGGKSLVMTNVPA